MKAFKLLLPFIVTACSNMDGKLEEKDNLRSIRNQQANYHQCYRESDSYLKKEKGKLDLTFTVDGQGQAKNIKILNSTFKDANLNACLQMVTREIEFPKRNEPFKQTLYFKP